MVPRPTIRPRGASTSIVLVGLAIVLLPSSATPAGAVDYREEPIPVPWQVYQRDREGRASIPAGGHLKARLLDEAGRPVPGVSLSGGSLVGVPAGGPYAVEIRPGGGEAVRIEPVFVGDLWVLAGQSNMAGAGELSGAAPPHPRVASLGLDGTWRRAEEPLHWNIDSPEPVHSGDPATRAARSAEEHALQSRGTGPGLTFAAAMVEATGVPVGLIPCARAASPIRLWSPTYRESSGRSLYATMIHQINQAGRRVRGVLWMQGEADALGSRFGDYSASYGRSIAALIRSVRDDLHEPELPFYLGQLGRYIADGNPRAWDNVREAIRRVPETIPHTAVVASIDLDLVDGIHLSDESQRRLGSRFAAVALHDLDPSKGRPPLTLRGAEESGGTILVRFDGVAGMPPGLRPSGRLSGFSILAADGEEFAVIGRASVPDDHPDAVLLRLTYPLPEGTTLWYGRGCDPFCILADGDGMAVPTFGPIPLRGTPGVPSPSRRFSLAVPAVVALLVVASAWYLRRGYRRRA